MRFTFGRFELDAYTHTLRSEGQPLAVQPRVLQTLQHLVEHAGRTRSPTELSRALGNSEVRASRSIPWNICQVRKVLGQAQDSNSPIETVRGKGYRVNVPVRRIEAAAGPQTTRPSSSSPFIGRHTVLADLRCMFESAHSGHGRLVVLTGPPGIGKTRLANEFAANVLGQGAIALTGRCFVDPIAPAFWPFIQMLRAYHDAGLGTEDLRKGAAALLQRLSPPEDAVVDPGLTDPPDEGGFWLLDRVRRWLLQATKEGTRLLIIDDLQWADERSLQLLNLLCDALSGTRLLVLVTLRKKTDEIGPDPVLMKATHATYVALAGFSESDVRCYLESALPSETAAALSPSVQRCTGGNPFFVSEALALIKTRRSEGEDAQDLDLVALPKRVLLARVAHLGRAGLSTLQAASVLGGEFMLPDLARLLECSEQALVGWVDLAIEHRLIRQCGSSANFRFDHDLLQEAIYESLTVGQRAELHGKAARALEGRLPDPKCLNALAHHYYHALSFADRERASHYCRLAGDAAQHVFAYKDAARYYDQAIAAQRAAPDTDATILCDILLRAAAALAKVGRPVESRQRCEEAISLAKHAGLAGPLVAAARLLRPSPLLAQQPDPLLSDALQSALKILPETASDERALLYAGLARVPPHSVCIDHSRALAEKALACARQLDSKPLIVEALHARIHSLSGPNDMNALLDLTEEILRLETVPASWAKAQAHLARYQTFTFRGEMAAADEALAAFGHMVKRLRLVSAVWEFDRLRIQRLLQTGDVNSAEAHIQPLRDEGVRLGIHWASAAYLAHCSIVQLHRTGNWTGLEALVHSQSSLPWHGTLPLSRALCLQLLIHRGCLEQARRELDALLHAPIPQDAYYVATLVLLVPIAVRLQAFELAQELQALLRPHRSLNPVTQLHVGLGSVAQYLGELSSLLGQHRQAQDDFEEARTANARLGYVPLSLHSQLSLAHALLATDSNRRRGQAGELAREVQQAAQQLEMQTLAAHAARLAARVGALQ